MTLGKRLESGQPDGRLDASSVLSARVVVAQRANELVDLAERLARDLFDRHQRRAGALWIPLLEQPGRPGLDEDHVDRMPGGVVEIACDARALLGRGKAALALGLLLGPP